MSLKSLNRTLSSAAAFALLILSHGAMQQTAPYASLTNDLEEATNFHPEPFSAIHVDASGRIVTINPYNNTLLRFPGLGMPAEWIAHTGVNPVSVGLWSGSGPHAGIDRYLVVCTGTHALFIHDQSGDVLDVITLESEPGDLVVNDSTNTAFVSCRGTNTVVAVNLGTREKRSYPIPCGQRPGPLVLYLGDPGADDDRVFVASTVTGNNSIFLEPALILEPSGPNLFPDVGAVLDLEDPLVTDDLPDEDVFRINPNLLPGDSGAVEAAVTGAGSLLFDLAISPQSDLWILSTESLNKANASQILNYTGNNIPPFTEPGLSGVFANNTLRTLPLPLPPDSAVVPSSKIDVDDTIPATAVGDYDANRSLNQVRSIAFMDFGSGHMGYLASPMSDVIGVFDDTGIRQSEDLLLPAGSQCYQVSAYSSGGTERLLALCLGSMTIEVFDDTVRIAGESLDLGEDPTPEHVRNGRDLMLDGSLSMDGRLTCFSCHEGGRSDQLSWMLSSPPGDFKDPMLTQSLLSIQDTFPHHWRGERDLGDFKVAFEGLLGSATTPSPSQIQDINHFMRSLRGPANPHQNAERVVDSRIHVVDLAGQPFASTQDPDHVYSGGPEGDAVNGQALYTTRRNFNNNTCTECHSLPTGSSANLLTNAGTFAPRISNIEVPHLRQLQNRGGDLDDVTVANVLIKVNENGFGFTNTGIQGNAMEFFNFVLEFRQSFNPGEMADVFRFVEQFDQGIAPAAHWAVWVDASRLEGAAGARTLDAIRKILIAGATSGWLDVVAFGRWDGTPERWLYDPSTGTLQSDDPSGPSPKFEDPPNDDFITKVMNGEASAVLMGVPLGNGYRVAWDPDADDFTDYEEGMLGTDPWDSESNGYSPGADTTAPMATVTKEFDTARSTKYHVVFSEDCTYTVSDDTAGRVRSFTRDDFVTRDTFVVTHSQPAEPLQLDPSSGLHATANGVLSFAPVLEFEDQAGNPGLAVALNFENKIEPLSMITQPGVWDVNAGEGFVHVASMSADNYVEGTLGNGLWSFSTLVHLDIQSNVAPSYDVDGGGSVNRRVFLSVLKEENGEFAYADKEEFGTTASQYTNLNRWDENLPLPMAVPFDDLPAPDEWVITHPINGNTTSFLFSFSDLQPGQRVKLSVQGVIRDHEAPRGSTLTVESAGLRELQPLRTENFHELVIEVGTGPIAQAD